MQISFDSLSALIRSEAHLPESLAITPATRFEYDLGITGDEAMTLMKRVEQHFGVPMSSMEGGYRKLFNLHEGEYLFSGDGLGLLALIPVHNHVSVRAFTIGELLDGLLRARDQISSDTA